MKFLLVLMMPLGAVIAQSQPATVVFFNSPNPYAEISYRIPGYLDGEQVANLKRNQYCAIEVQPGKHSVRSNSREKALILETERGKTYYVRLELKHGTLNLSNVWLVTLIDPQQAEREIAGYDKVPPKQPTKK